MHFTLISSMRARHQILHQAAMADGLLALGVKSEKTFDVVGLSRYVACWGWRNGKILRERGHQVLVMERGYLGDRFIMTSLGWNGLNGHAKMPTARDDGGARFRAIANLKPWNDNGEYALILGQVPNDASLGGRNLMPWYEETAQTIKHNFGLPVRFRQHPDVVKHGIWQEVEGTIKSTGSLEHELSGAAFSVCYNSNAGVDSILAGVPCMVDNQGSMAWPVASHNLSDIVRPDREKWAYDLAWQQWTLDEIASGEALKGILEIAC